MQAWQFQCTGDEIESISMRDLAEMTASGRLPLNTPVRHPKRTNGRWVELHWIASTQECKRTTTNPLETARPNASGLLIHGEPVRKTFAERVRCEVLGPMRRLAAQQCGESSRQMPASCPYSSR